MRILDNYDNSYQQRSSVKAVIHAHSRNLMPYVVSHLRPKTNHIPYIDEFLGDTALVPYLLCGTDKLVVDVFALNVGASL